MLPVLFTSLLLADPVADTDFLRFENGDTLHGTYLGIDEGPLLQWQSPEATDTIAFEVDQIRKLMLMEGQGRQPISSGGTVELVNGDVLPGSIISVGEDSVSLQTDYAGLLTIPRDAVSSLAPNLPGGPPLYAGPFNSERWQILPEPDASEDEEEADWALAGGAWYSSAQSESPLCLDARLADQVSIRFRVAWKKNLNLIVALHADFKAPLDKEDEEQAELEWSNLLEEGGGGDYPRTYGSAYVLAIHQNFTRLTRSFYTEDGQGKNESFRNNKGGNLRLSQVDEVTFEIRSDREKGSLSLFADGQLITEWEGLTDEHASGSWLAFDAINQSRLRISDIVISPWNGMPDSARSMVSEERDIVLLNNGTDRLSGTLLNLEEDMFLLETDYTNFQIPAPDIEVIHFATDSLRADEPPLSRDESCLVHMRPRGKITFAPHSGRQMRLDGNHPILGGMRLDLNYAFLLEFDPEATIFDNWDENF
ncbi:MAG: hypothetical protein Q7Q71_01815 [Verrucomicrobiota bacterium JB023]|nr:hypothetical protein [Verrucomicrobiota bacterium JB023]